jgi:2-polyprenyl-3-methyl-5-hydroxy-6-metoxy-1,4-benzoquinol methylase
VSDRQKELDKYREVYAKHEAYRMSAGRLEAAKRLVFEHTGSLLDVSCGRGEFLKAARDSDLFDVVMGTETVPALCNDSVIQAEITSLPFEVKSFDVVTCFDVIEHVLEQDIVPGLKELERVCRGTIIISAADYSDMWDGVEMHPSARPYSEWDKLFRETFSGRVRHVGKTPTSEVWAVKYGS